MIQIIDDKSRLSYSEYLIYLVYVELFINYDFYT